MTAAAPGRPEQGRALLEGRATHPLSGEQT